ncbi:Histone acetyltransferase HAC1 [Quillaja saponaria]|uniref:histone acetyltransferase n=1 Tax=Quillaja saponaria TaxID=32244 RepID=A0AAD7PXY1_QUISA|nr:Histone acetyltransferase HAC1 [Quillaja saponaria]
MSQSLSLQDSLQSQFHKLDAQQNLKQSKWSCEQFQKQFFAQSNMGSVDQNEVSCQMSTRNPFEQPQLPSRLSNGNQHFTSQNSTFIYDSNGTAHENSCSRPETSPEHKILLAYVNYKSLAALGGETPVSFVKYLHSTAFDDGMRSREQYSTLLSHFDNCQGDNCHICWPLKHFFVTDELLPNLEPTNDMGIGFTQRDYDGADCAHFEGRLRPAKRLKMETPNVSPFTDKISHRVAPKMLHSCSPDGLLDFQQQLESPISINSNEMDNSMQPFRNPMVDSTSVTETHNSVIHNTSNLTFESETILSEGLKAGFESEKVHPKSTSISEIRHNLIDNTSRLAIVSKTILSEGLETGLKSEEVHLKCSDEISGNVKENANRLVSIMHNFPKNASANGREDVQDKMEFNQTGPGLMCDVVTSKADNGKSTKYMYLEMNGVSLTEIFTADQIREHIRSLRQLIVKGTLEDEQRIGVNSCKLCALDKLLFAPVPLYCTFCGARIKRSAIYYCKGEEFDTQHCFCTSCYKGFRGGCISFNGISIDKTMLDSKRNDGETEEPWVQCDKCEGWQHQICALFNDKRDLEGKAEYICPICCLEEIKNGERVPLPKSAVFSAKELPRTMLSDHIENRLFSRLKQEREDRAKVKGKNVDEVSGADDLVVRVVLSVDKQLKVKKQFLDIFCEENYPAEFPYRSKVILLFQKIEGVDVCLFGMYVQEFGSECCQPNQRCVYISYLDSVKYFRPETETVTGEALRTFVYHEILIGYLDFCKKRGFSTCYIWACPPLKGEDYILYCHPQAQKTPKSDKLRKWYQIMLRKAAKENIVVSFTNIYDHFFVPTGEYNSKITAARLPYFDGDYWSGAAIDVIRNIEKESGGDYQRKVKKVMTKRTLKAMGHTNPSDGATKDILLMQKLGQSILPVKEDFIVVQLQFVCVHCSEVISSGNRWFCSQCEKYQICERCHNSEQNLVGKEIHTSVSGEQHILSQVTVNIPSDTKEKDATLDNGLFENRHTLLSFCQQNHFQFDTLRRAKHSSMMIVHHLRNSTVMTVGTTCCICLEDNVVHCWLCDICMDFVVCVACYKEKGANCHVHSLTQRSLEAKGLKGNKESLRKALLTRELLEVLQHAFQCRTNKNQPCSYPNCIQIKKLFIHANRCSIRASGGCEPCKKAWLGLNVHSRNCRESDCRIPRCMDLKRHAEWLQLQSETRRRAAFVEFARQKRT